MRLSLGADMRTDPRVGYNLHLDPDSTTYQLGVNLCASASPSAKWSLQHVFSHRVTEPIALSTGAQHMESCQQRFCIGACYRH